MKHIFVIVPIYNGEKYLERCLESIVNQAYKNLTIICVNDGSTDNSLAILKKYKDIVVLSKQNGGLSSARNYALDFIKDKLDENNFVSFIDCDDYVDLDYFEKLCNLAEDSQSEIVCTSFLNSSSSKESKHKNIDVEGKYSSFEATKILVEDKTLQSHAPTKLYKANLFKDIRFPEDIKFMEDQFTTYKVFCLANNVYISNYCGYHYWQSEVSLTRSNKTSEKMFSGLKAYYSVCKHDYPFSDTENKEIISKANDALADAFLMLFPRIKFEQLSDKNKLDFKSIKKYIREYKIIKNYKPVSKNSKLKRFAYVYCKPFYKVLFKIFS